MDIQQQHRRGGRDRDQDGHEDEPGNQSRFGAPMGPQSDWQRYYNWRSNQGGRYGQGYGGAQPDWNAGEGPDYHYRSRRRRMPRSWQRTDERIREDIYERIIDRVHLDAEDVTVEVSSGKVTLSGEVRDRRDRHEIEDIADSVSGVSDIDNHLRVKRDQPGTPASPGSSLSGVIG